MYSDRWMGSVSLAPQPALGSVGVPPLPERARQSVSRGCKCQEALAQPPGDFCGGPWQTLVTEGLDRSHCGSSGIHSFARLGGFVAESVSVSVGVSVNVSVCVYVSVIHLPLRRFLDRAQSKARAGTRARVIPSARTSARARARSTSAPEPPAESHEPPA